MFKLEAVPHNWKKQLGMLEKARNRVIRVILHSDEFNKIEYLLQILWFISITQRLCYKAYIYLFTRYRITCYW